MNQPIDRTVICHSDNMLTIWYHFDFTLQIVCLGVSGPVHVPNASALAISSRRLLNSSVATSRIAALSDMFVPIDLGHLDRNNPTQQLELYSNVASAWRQIISPFSELSKDVKIDIVQMCARMVHEPEANIVGLSSIKSISSNSVKSLISSSLLIPPPPVRKAPLIDLSQFEQCLSDHEKRAQAHRARAIPRARATFDDDDDEDSDDNDELDDDKERMIAESWVSSQDIIDECTSFNTLHTLGGAWPCERRYFYSRPSCVKSGEAELSVLWSSSLIGLGLVAQSAELSRVKSVSPSVYASIVDNDLLTDSDIMTAIDQLQSRGGAYPIA